MAITEEWWKPEQSTVSQVVLERLRYSLMQRLEPGLLDVSADMVRDVLTDSVIARIRFDVLADKLPPEHVESTHYFGFEFPASWWQMWKRDHADRWFARWLVKRRPVQYVTEQRRANVALDLERYRTYPEAQHLPADFGRAFKAYRIDGPWWNEVQ